jgi:aminoglycoside phosphotransferase (APT) family kinase protein
MLATVLPAERDRLDWLAGRLELDRDASTCRAIHGDLHEAQVVVDAGRITGLLDIDDVGVGDEIDDVATLVAHLLTRAATVTDGRPIVEYAERLRAGLGVAFDRRDLDQAVAATLIGLATGPFRIQQDDWRQITVEHLDRIERLLDAADR